MNELIASNEVTMTSREIAELVEKRHDNVKRTIESLANTKVISCPQIEDGEKSANGVIERIYKVGKRDSYIIVAQLSPEFTARLVDRWQELEAKQKPSLSDPKSLRALLLGYTERVIELESKVANDAPKVQFAEAVRKMEGACHIGDFAKTLGIGRNTFFRMLRADGILMAGNLPYQKYIDDGRFVVIEQVPYTNSEGKSFPAFTAMLTGKGQVWLERKYRAMEAA